jgi:hypothetical protein
VSVSGCTEGEFFFDFATQARNAKTSRYDGKSGKLPDKVLAGLPRRKRNESLELSCAFTS